jgi:hypothetical protein
LDLNAGEVAIPFISVTAVAVLVFETTNVPLAPLLGAVKFTVIPLTGCPNVFVTFAFSGSRNWDCNGAPWLDPLSTIMKLGKARSKFSAIIPLFVFRNNLLSSEFTELDPKEDTDGIVIDDSME